MAEYLKSECPHCGQSIEYGSEGTGETIPCPTCDEPFVLTPLNPAPTEVFPPSPPIPTASATAAPPASTPATPAPKFSPPPAATSRRNVHRLAELPGVRATPEPPTYCEPASPAPAPRSTSPAPLEKVINEFGNDAAFVGHQPTREQIARAWAYASFHRVDPSKPATHLELVAAVKKLFPEFKAPKAGANGSHSKKHG